MPREDFDRGLSIFQWSFPRNNKEPRENIQKFMKGASRDGEQYIGVRKDGSRFLYGFLTPVLRENKTVGFRIILIDTRSQKIGRSPTYQSNAIIWRNGPCTYRVLGVRSRSTNIHLQWCLLCSLWKTPSRKVGTWCQEKFTQNGS